jgi:hypothetical protein
MTATLPADLQEILADIQASDRAADTLVAGLSDDQLHWQPDGGKAWSIAQCLEHLATMNVVYGNAVRSGLELARTKGWARRSAARPGFFGAMFARSMEPPVRRRLRAPRQTTPSSGLPRQEVLRRYHDAHASIFDIIRDAASFDVNRATFRNPFISLVRVKVSTGLRVIAAHDRRHLWQAEQVRLRPDFPRRPAHG